MENADNVVLELQQISTQLETMTAEVQTIKDSSLAIGNALGMVVCMLFIVAVFTVRNLILSWTKRGVKDV